MADHRSSTLIADSLPDWLQYQSAARPDAVGIRHKQLGIWHERDWRAIRQETLHLAALLSQQGFIAGDTLYLLSHPRPEALLLSLAAQWLGGTAAPLDPALPASAVVGLLRHTQPAFLFAEAQPQVDTAIASQVGFQLVLYANARGLGAYREAYLQAYPVTVPPLAGERRIEALPGHTAFSFYRIDSEGHIESQHFSHQEIIAQARQLTEQEALSADEEALAARAFAASAHARYLLAPWLLAGFRLNFPENLETRDLDRRELGPTVVVGTAATYGRVAAQVAERLPHAGTWRRRLVDWALRVSAASSASKPLQRWLARALVLDPLRDVIGFGRTRFPLLVGDAPTPETTALFQALDIHIRTWPDASGWQPAAPFSAGNAARAVNRPASTWQQQTQKSRRRSDIADTAWPKTGAA